MTTIDLSAKLQDFSSEGELTDSTETLGRILGSLLKSSPTGDAVKFLDWCIDLFRSGKITVDNADFKLIRDFVASNTTAWALARGQILKAMDAAKEKGGK